MKPLPDAHFNNHRKWDQFRRFHAFSEHNTVVTFDDGSALINDLYRSNFGGDDYRLWRDRNFIICNTSDLSFLKRIDITTSLGDRVRHKVEFVDPEDDTKTLTNASLAKITADSSEGQQLLIDLDHNVAVRFSRRRVYRPMANLTFTSPVSKDAMNCGGVFYPSPDAAPIGAAIRVTKPTKIDAEQKAAFDALTSASRSWAFMEFGYERTKTSPYTFFNELKQRYPEIAKVGIFFENPFVVDHEYLIDKTFNDVQPYMRARLAFAGWRVSRAATHHENLKVRVTPVA